MLPVVPETNDIALLFSSLPVKSVWRFAPKFQTQEFTENPLEPLPESPHWQTWYRPGTTNAVNTLFSLSGGSAYLIEASVDCTWITLGRPVIPKIEWYPGYMNLVGFPVNPAAPPYFTPFFESCDEIDASGTTPGACPIYQLITSSAGYAFQQVRRPTTTRMTAGAAYWIKLEKATDFTAPMEITTPSSDGLVFGKDLHDLMLRIRNRSKTNTVVSVRQKPSATPPVGYPEKAGAVPLTYLITDPGSNRWTWATNFPAVLTHALAPGETWRLQVGVLRKKMSDQKPSGTDGITYQSLLEVTDSQGLTRSLVPVSAEYAAQGATEETPYNPYGGLWVGEASITRVSRPETNGVGQLEPVVAPFPLRLILHNGWSHEGSAVTRCQLLQKAIVGELPPATSNDSARAMIWAREDSLPSDARKLTRISSVTVPPDGLALQGDFAVELTGSNVLSYASPVNPFKHVYHPSHDNRDADGNMLGEGVESYSITRVVTLAFDTNAMAQATWPHMGTDYVVGTYRETVTGLRKEPVAAEGTFTLKRIMTTETITE